MLSAGFVLLLRLKDRQKSKGKNKMLEVGRDIQIMAE